MELLVMFIFILNILKVKSKEANSEENLPTLCHVCKHTVIEFLEELDHSANSGHVLQLGQVLQSEKHKTIFYHKSGLRLIEALENTCEKIKDYKVHKDKPNHLRYAKDESSTFITLKNLKKRGVSVNLGFPDEMWDSPDAEIVDLKRQCENIVEKYEEYLNDWYFNHQENNLFDWFCKDLVLKGKNDACLKGTDNLGEVKSKNEAAEEDDGSDDIDNDDDNNSNDDHNIDNNNGYDIDDNNEEKIDDELGDKVDGNTNHVENPKGQHSEL